MIRFGGPVYPVSSDYGSNDPVLLARLHKKKGFTAAFAPEVGIGQTERIRDIRNAFAAEEIMIAETGYWENLMDLDPDTRKTNREKMAETLSLADELGARCAVGLVGSYCHGGVTSVHSAKNFSEEAFQEAVDLARLLIDTVKPKKACFAFEVYPLSLVDSPEMICRLLEAIERDRFAVHLDLANFINCPRAYWKNDDIMRECVRLFGGRIVSAHAKDLKMREPSMTVQFEEVPAGRGNIDIAASIRELHKLPHDVPYMMEHLDSEEDYDKAAVHIRKVAYGEGIAI